MKQLLLSNIPTVYLANYGYLHNDQTRLQFGHFEIHMCTVNAPFISENITQIIHELSTLFVYIYLPPMNNVLI